MDRLAIGADNAGLPATCPYCDQRREKDRLFEIVAGPHNGEMIDQIRQPRSAGYVCIDQRTGERWPYEKTVRCLACKHRGTAARYFDLSNDGVEVPAPTLIEAGAERRLSCSFCHGDQFSRYKGPDGQQVPDPAKFQIRRQGPAVEWREVRPHREPTDFEWAPFPGGTVYCIDMNCNPGNYRVHDPSSGQAGEL